MKYLFLFSLFFHVLQANAQFNTHVYWTEQSTLPARDVVYFNRDSPLQWTHFRGKPQGDNHAAALTASGFGYKADFKSSGSKADLNVGVYCFFNKNNSWVRPGRTTQYILSHEQDHFNISFIAACVFVNRLKSAKLNKTNYEKELVKMYNESCEYMNKLQEEYDAQTRNGQLQELQAKWHSKLAQALAGVTGAQ